MSEIVSASVNEGDIDTLKKMPREDRVSWLELDPQRSWKNDYLAGHPFWSEHKFEAVKKE